MIKLGLIGCGWVSSFYGQATMQMAGRVGWAWAADADKERAERFCAQFGGQAFASYRDAPTPDAYVIATPHHLHAPIYLDIADRGRPVLIEKPLALTLEECDHMIAARDAAGSILMVGYVNRYRPGPQAMKAAVDRGEIGTPLFGDYSQLGDQEGYVGGWILKRATLGGGCFFSSAGHILDLAMWLQGRTKRVRVETAHFRLPMEGEDTALATVAFENGQLATLRESWCARGADAWQRFTLYGTGGSIEMTYTPRGPVPEWGTCLWDTKLVLRTAGRTQTLLESAAPFEFAGQFNHFIDCIENNRRPLTDAESGREVIRLIREAEARANEA
jgi:predicted dehydrogenase